jgi:hydroxylaminobenzene mutase
MGRSSKQTLLIAGTLLFLVGLVSGVAVPLVENPRMGLSAHLAGVQSAVFLLAVGAAWSHVRLSRTASRIGVWLGIGSLYAFWTVLQLAAIWGTGRATPIAGEGFEAEAWKETLVELVLTVASGAAIVAAAVVLAGFWRGRQGAEPD